jgi:predicted ATPase/DNA-binding winged helix-turn-helix (wHTH) protein
MTLLPTRLHFDPFVLDIAAAQLSRDGQVLALRPKAFALLQALAQRPGELVTKDELLDTVWGRRFITEGVIKAVVAELRGVLGDDPKAPRWIATVPRRGYRFAAAVQAVAVPVRPEAAAMPAAAVAGNLPHALDPIIGRETALAALAGLLGTQRVVTLAGPSGIGKTRLLLALGAAQAPAWPDGGWLVELAALAPEATDPASLCALLAQTLQLGAAAAGSTASLARALQPLRLLLLLDNAEHLLPVLAPLVATLLPQAPGLRIVVTSQEPLRIPGEQLFRLAPLALPPLADDADAQRLMASAAVQLFVARVAARLPGFALAAQQQQAVADICRALDGLPLALELAAARVPLLGVHGIAELLLGADDGARLSLLSQGARNAAPRQRSLRDALAWSHRLLDDGQRRVLRRLAVFRGGFTLGAAQTVCSDTPLGSPSSAAGDDWGVLDALHALADKSLLAPVAERTELAEAGESAAPGASSAPRFKLLESVRAFALEQLMQAGELHVTQARHARAVLVYWAQADARSLSDPALRWVTRHLPEIDNLRAALRWACADGAAASGDEALALFNHTAMLWHRAGLGAEGQAWCEQLRGRSQASADAALRAGFELVVAVLGAYTSAYSTAQGQAAAQWAAQAFEAQGDSVRAYFALYLLNQFTQTRSDAGREALLARMAALEQADWGELLTRYGRNSRGYACRLAGRPDDYLAYCRDELARCRRLGAVVETWNVAQGLMLAEHDMGAVAAALRVGREALAEIRAAGRLRQHAALLALWTTMLAESGDTAGARVALAETLPVLAGAGTPWMARIALCWLATNEGRDEAAARLLGWHDACVLADGRAAGGGYITRALLALINRLQGLADAPSLRRWRAAGATLGDDGAQRLALQVGAAA